MGLKPRTTNNKNGRPLAAKNKISIELGIDLNFLSLNFATIKTDFKNCSRKIE